MQLLRNWQSECIEKALGHFEHHRHFFVQATPGSGKTFMAAELARRMLQERRIDFVVCFAPSCEVVTGLNRTFTDVLQKRFGNTLASIGAAYTYQSMEHQSEDFWRIFRQSRTLVVFDEIHHCAGQDSHLSNSWGQKIIQEIQDATYTIGLSGTPWRSDDLPIALARYSTPEGQLICDYRYSLLRAIQDGVCREPRITLIDNPMIRFVEDHESRLFSTIAGLLSDTPVSYEELLRHDEIMHAVTDAGVARLEAVRTEMPNAGGLVVATDIDHAHRVAEMLHGKGEDCVVVTNKTPNARDQIDAFRHSNARWIVAVGMVSEGTDIPRLRVCCYLSRIRTELHYRQVLGRILRQMGSTDQVAWLYAIAEPILRDYSGRIAEDLPDAQAVLTSLDLSRPDENDHDAPSSALDDMNRTDQGEYDEGQAVEMIKSGGSGLSKALPMYAINFSNYYREYLMTII